MIITCTEPRMTGWPYYITCESQDMQVLTYQELFTELEPYIQQSDSISIWDRQVDVAQLGLLLSVIACALGAAVSWKSIFRQFY